MNSTEKMKERAFRIARLRKISDELIDTYADEKDPGLRLSLFEIIGNLRLQEKRILDGVE